MTLFPARTSSSAAVPAAVGRPEGDEEGFVRVHEGIHGVGEFDEATRAWRNPVAKVSIRRIH